MTQFVIAYAVRVPHPDGIILMRRTKKDWQEGRLNLPGGHLEPDESPIEGACRELKEETGIVASLTDTQLIGKLVIGHHHIYVCHCPYREHHNGHKQLPTNNCSEGDILHRSWQEVKDDPDLLPELQIIIPLCQAHVHGWRVQLGFDSEWMVQLQTPELG
jgi:8-oxo-dGTP pyrophosphatase MutT (NUDIX family)